MITLNGIQYTWRQIFYRLGVHATKDYFLIGDKKVYFHYDSYDTRNFNDSSFHLVVSKSKPGALNQICTESGYSVKSLNKSALLPDASYVFPVQTLPILFWGEGTPNNRFAEIIDNHILVLQADLIQSIFFLLSRYEEHYLKVRDKHGRFPYTASAACRYQFIELPLVDLYVLALKIWLENLSGQTLSLEPKLEIHLSHDIDFLSLYQPMTRWLKLIAKDAIRLKRQRLFEDFRANRKKCSDDPYFIGLKILAEVSTSHHLTSVFNLMATAPSRWDDGYSLDSERFKEAVKLICEHGHRIGLHASYRAYDSPELLRQEKTRLEEAAGINISICRQHYLRVQTPQSWIAMSKAGLSKDTSYGFPEHEGFRCGTCFPFTVFNLLEDCELPLIEEPLIIMDGTLRTYRRLGIEDAVDQIKGLAEMCKSVGGTFTLLWHNSSFFRDWEVWGEKYPHIIANLIEMAKD